LNWKKGHQEMEARKKSSTDHILDCNPSAGSLLGPNRVEAVPHAKSKEPDDGTGSGQVKHVGNEQPVQEDEASGIVVLLDHGPDRDRPGNEEEHA
jgi:hypothetical protein